jgi:comEA protein
MFLRQLFILITTLGFIFTANTAMSLPSFSHPHTDQTVQTVQKPIDLNKAEVKDLAAIKGLGSKKAQAIIDYRKLHGDFKSVDELTNIKGIGHKLLKKIKNDITVTTN